MKPLYSFTNKEELDLIHEYSMKMLEEYGVSFICEEAVDIFKAHGFHSEGNKIFIKEKDVMSALKTVPKSFYWYGRNSHVVIGGGETICAPSYGPIFILEDGTYHNVDKQDFLNLTKLCASSKVLDVSNPNALDFSFMAQEIASNWAMATVLLLDDKPAIGMVDGKKHAADSIKMAKEFYDIYEKPVLAGLISVASPCHYSEAMCEALIQYAKEGQPVFITPSALNGLTAPGSIASLLLLNNVEILAGVVLAQLINPGTPVIYGNQSHGCDLRYAMPTIGSPEQCLIFSAIKALGDYYGLPIRTGGSSCDAKQVDMQAGVESFATMYTTLLSGADLMVHSCGSLDTDNSLSYDKFIYDEEILLYIKRILRGFEVSEKTLLYDLFGEVPAGGDFLNISDSSLRTSTKYYRNDYISLNVPIRISSSAWLSKGAEKITDRTKAIYKKRLEEYSMPLIEPERLAILEKYVPKELLDC